MIYKEIELPDNLRPQADKYIKNVIDELEKEDKLKTIDTATYYMLAGSFNTYLIAKEEEDKKGITTVSPTGLISIAPWTKIAKDSLTATLRLLQDTGLTLSSRAKLKIVSSDGGEESMLSKFMSQNEEFL